MLKPFLFLLLLCPLMLYAQQSIKGNILDSDTGKPVPDASVFLNSASVGTKSADDGSFTLYNAKNGHYDLIVTCIGYQAYSQTVAVFNGDIVVPVIKLKPKIAELKEVVIKYVSDSDRKRYLQTFLTEFFGTTKNSSECKLLNPDVISFDYNKRTEKLKASADEFLIIENKALGYRIKYLLASFLKDALSRTVSYTGVSVFEPMTGSDKQQSNWNKNRTIAYLGSQMNFLRACINGDMLEEGFTVRELIRVPTTGRLTDSVINAKIKIFSTTYGNNDSLSYWRNELRSPRFNESLGKRDLSDYEFVKLTQVKGIYAIGDYTCLLIKYKTKSDYFGTHSTIYTFKRKYAYFDSNGIVINPLDANIEGYWGTQRMADLLPVDYQLPQK